MAITYHIKLRITDGELKQVCEELDDEELTEENITKKITETPTFRRIMDRLYAQMVKTDKENKKNAAAEEAADERHS